MSTHAELSPSSADRWMQCPGSVPLSEGIEDQTSEYAAEGTQAHALAEAMLMGDFKTYESEYAGITEEMADYVEEYVTAVLERATGAEVFEVEAAYSIEHLTKEPKAKGTTDALILHGNVLEVHDLKYGRGHKVEAVENKQLMIYGLAALEELSLIYEVETVQLFIHQPRLQHVSQTEMSVTELEAFAAEVSAAAESCAVARETVGEMKPIAWQDRFLKPSESACRWCKAKATCPKLREEVMTKVLGEFPDYTTPIEEQAGRLKPEVLSPEELAHSYLDLDFIEAWIAAVRAKTYELLNHGVAIPGLKLVEGRRPAKAWADAEESEKAMKAMRLKADEMYSKKLSTPTQVMKVVKDRPKLKDKIQALITQGEGKPTVALASDKRAAIVIEQFEDVTEAIDDLFDRSEHPPDAVDGLVEGLI